MGTTGHYKCNTCNHRFEVEDGSHSFPIAPLNFADYFPVDKKQELLDLIINDILSDDHRISGYFSDVVVRNKYTNKIIHVLWSIIWQKFTNSYNQSDSRKIFEHGFPVGEDSLDYEVIDFYAIRLYPCPQCGIKTLEQTSITLWDPPFFR